MLLLLLNKNERNSNYHHLACDRTRANLFARHGILEPRMLVDGEIEVLELPIEFR